MINTNNTLGTRINDILGSYGLPGGLIGAQLDALAGNPAGVLNNLRDAFLEAGLGRATDGRERNALLGRIPPHTACPHPHVALGRARHHGIRGYAQRIDLAPGAGNSPFDRLFDPRRKAAAKFERALKENPLVRRLFERAVGGKVRFDGVNDGKITIVRPGVRHPTLPGLQFGNTVAGMVGALEAAIQRQLGALVGLGQGAFGPAALGQLLGGLGGLGAVGTGSWNPAAAPGQINNTSPGYERAHQSEVAGILNDPSLTVEDKITLMLMAIMKKMDKDIEAQAQNVNKIQQQQGNKSGSAGGAQGGAAGASGSAQGGDSKSIDVETMKLKRMIDKRSQMFDMLRQIIDKYNETAKGLIQSIGR